MRILLVLFALAVSLPAQQKRIYIANDDHTDYMWTGNEEEYRQAFVEMLDHYLDLADKTKNEPAEFQSRWHCDGTIWLWNYERNKTAPEFARLIERIRDGHISVPLNALVSTYGGTPMEAILRGMYYAGSLERRFNIRLPLAIAMENQTLPYGLGALWAGSGARYSWKGICGCLTKLNKTKKRPHEIYWWQGLDDSKILMKWNSMLVANSGARTMGGYAEARTPGREIEFVDSNPEFKSIYPFPVIGIFGKGWDDLKTLTDEFVTIAKEKTNAGRKIIVSNINDFFEDFEKNHGSGLPNYSASFGNEWDLYTASITEVSARVRRSVEKLRPAEAMATLVSLQRPEFMNGRTEARDQAWMNLGLYWEHNWTADGHWVTRQERNQWGRRMADGVANYVDTLHGDAAFALGGLIRKSGAHRRFYVFNPLSWVRSDASEIPYDGPAEIHVVDLATGEDVPFELVTPLSDDRFPRKLLRVQATALPPIGYKVYEIRPGAGKVFSTAAEYANGVLENATYRVTVEPRGAISSLIDKTKANREFAGKTFQRQVNDLGMAEGRLELEHSGPVSVTLRATGASPLKHRTRITLYRDSPRIDIRNEILQNFGGTHTWSFAFKLTNPDVRHEESGAIIRAKYLADGGHYSSEMSRLEWLTLNHFADMTGQDGAGLTLSNADCAFMRLGSSDILDNQSQLDTKTPQIQVLAGGQIDGPKAGIAKQGGDSYFLQRFALRTHGGYDSTAAMKFALEHQNPPVSGWVRGGAAYPEQSYSAAALSNPNVLLWSLKPSEEGIGSGVIARFWNLSATPENYSVSLAGGIQSARQTTHIETDLAELPVSNGVVPMKATGTQIQTVRLRPAGSRR